MTTPAPLPLGSPDNALVWCKGCSEFYAQASQPLCPVCKDKQRRGEP